MINLDNVDEICFLHSNKGGCEVKFIKHAGWRDSIVIGAASFDTKEDMQCYVNKYLEPLKHDKMKEISQGLINLEYVLRDKL
ncbi:hypothetical protein KM788_03130 [Clostridium tyrobutyricum]|nr:hypothetical protein [Clostridium tyrobutyricum]